MLFAIGVDNLLSQLFITSIERSFRDHFIFGNLGGGIGLEIETVGQVAVYLIVNGLVFLLPQHNPGPEPASPSSHDGIVKNLATLGVVERYAVVVAH